MSYVWCKLFTIACVCSSIIFPCAYVDFDESMELNNDHVVLKSDRNRMLLDFFKKRYAVCNPRTFMPSEQRIPETFHQIWLGSSFPEKYKAWQQTLRQLHPGWQLKLWQEEDIEHFPWKNRDLFDKARNYGEKSDIWRYEILEQYGGVYIDTDFEALRSLELLHHSCDFYIGIQPLDTGGVQLGTGIIGCKPGHPFLQYVIEMLRHVDSTKPIVARTGPIFFTNCLIHYAQSLGLHDCILPASYFYPRGYTAQQSDRDKWVKPESLAVHHWAGSWLHQTSDK